MLLQISIKNFAIFKDAVIEPDTGYNAITGESGAGKSVVVNAMSLICGARAVREMIRTGKNIAVVEAVFRIPEEKRVLLIEKYSISDELLVITRELYREKPSICKINGKIRNLSLVTEIASLFIDIHGQYENQTLLDVENHIIYLDEFSRHDLAEPLKEYSHIQKTYEQMIESIVSVSGGDAEREREKQILEFQIEDIDSAGLGDLEENSLFNRKTLLENAEKFKNATAAAINYLENEDKSTVNDIGAALKELESLPQNDNLQKAIEVLRDSYYQIQDTVGNLGIFIENIEFNDSEYESILDKIDKLNDLKRKYGSTVDEILEYRKNALEKLEKIINFKKDYARKLGKLEVLEKKLYELDDKLTSVRISNSRVLINLLIGELKEMGMKDAVIRMAFSKSDRKNSLGFSIFPERGRDSCEFLVSLNKGLEPVTIGKVASGGEMSRIMLSFKTVFSYKDDTNTVVFDEIDSGISGDASIAVADKLEKLSADKQIICITHLPQIAARAKTNFVIRKKTSGDVTDATIKKISGREEKIEVIASLTDGENITPEGREHALKLLKAYNKHFN